jgi:signal transduction histidine kinase
VVAEQQAAHPNHPVELELPDLPPLQVDPVRLGQLLSNLLANALTHGKSEAPVRVTAGVTASDFELSVSNGGPAISGELLPHLFQPFFRARPKVRGEGLGLGLFIARAVAEAHGGTLMVDSMADLTTFRFRMPRQIAA